MSKLCWYCSKEHGNKHGKWRLTNPTITKEIIGGYLTFCDEKCFVAWASEHVLWFKSREKQFPFEEE